MGEPRRVLNSLARMLNRPSCRPLAEAFLKYPTLTHVRAAIEVARGTSGQFDEILAAALRQHPLEAVPDDLCFSIPRETVSLAAVAIELGEQKLRSLEPTDSKLAFHMTHLASRLADAGETERATKPAQGAVWRLRQLSQDSGEVMYFLAEALDTLATIYHQLARDEEALQLSLEAVQLRMRLVTLNSAVHRGGLISALNNLAGILVDLERYDEANRYCQMASENLDSLPADTHRRQVHYATLHTNLCLIRTGTSSVDSARAALDAYRDLADEFPGRYMPKLAGAWVNLTQCLARQGQIKEAHEAGRTAVDLSRSICPRDTNRGRSTLASALVTLASLSSASNRKEAIALAEEAAHICDEILKLGQSKSPRLKALCLTVLAMKYCEEGWLEKARTCAEQSVEIHRELIVRGGPSFQHRLATSLVALAEIHELSGHLEASLAASAEGVTQLTALATQDHVRYAPSLLVALSAQAETSAKIGHTDDALNIGQKAIEVFGSLCAEQSFRVAHQILHLYTGRVLILANLGRCQEAWACLKEADALCRTLPDSAAQHSCSELISEMRKMWRVDPPACQDSNPKIGASMAETGD